MKRNMKHWLQDYLQSPVKKAMPILSFPGVQLLEKTVDELVRDGHLQALCMKAIADRYDMGISVSLMDLSVEAEAFGAEVHYSEDDVPTMHGALITDEDQADALEVPQVGAGRTGECIKGIKEAKELITDRPVVAGIVGPYTLAGRLLDMTEIMILCYEEPEMVETVLEKATTFLIEYAKAFKAAGANGILMAEPVAGLLSPDLEEEFSSPYVKKIVDAVQDERFAVIYHNCGDNAHLMLDSITATGCAAYHFGNSMDLERDIISHLPSDTLVMGNIDPAGTLRMGTEKTVKEETLALLERCSKYPNFVMSSGCDIPPATPLENLDAFCKAVQEF